MLQGYYEEMEMLSEPILATMQVRDLMPMIHHPKTKDIAGNIIFITPDDKKELIKVMADIADKMSVVGVNPGAWGGRAESTTSDTQKIRKLKCKEKALKKKLKQKNLETPHSSKLDQDPTDYLPKETIEVIRKATGKHGSKVVAWAFKGWATDQAKKCSIRGAKTDDRSDGSSKADEEEEPSTLGRSGASASMGQCSNNCHPKNPNDAMHQLTTGIIVYLNSGAVKWYSKQQNTVELSTFGSEFVSLKIAMEMNCAMCYKLHMMGVPIAGPTNMFGDNKSVV